MKILDARNRKEELEKSIRDELIKFEQETGLSIDDIKINSILDLRIGYKGINSVKIEARL